MKQYNPMDSMASVDNSNTMHTNEFVNSIIEKKPSILTVRGSERHRRAVSDGRSQKSEGKVRFSPD